jgi:hypothetical protein
MQALAMNGQADDVPLMIRLACENAPELGDSAKASLVLLNAKGATEQIVNIAEHGQLPQRLVAVRILSERDIHSAMPVLVKLLDGPEKKVRSEVLKIINNTGQIEQIPTLIKRLEVASDRDAAEDAIKAICGRSDKSVCEKMILPVIEQASNPAMRAPLLRTLHRIGSPGAFSILLKARSDADEDIRDAAIRTLADWPDLTAEATLLEIAKTNNNSNYSLLALRGYLRLASDKNLNAEQRLAMYTQAMALANRPEEKRLMIPNLAEIETIKSLQLLTTCLKDPAVVQEASGPILSMARKLQAKHAAQVMEILKAMKDRITDPKTLQQVENLLAAMENAR